MKIRLSTLTGLVLLLLPTMAWGEGWKEKCAEGRDMAERGLWAAAEMWFAQCANLLGEPESQKDHERLSGVYSDVGVAREALEYTESAKAAYARALELWPENGCAKRNAGLGGDCEGEPVRFSTPKEPRFPGVEVHFVRFPLSSSGPEIQGLAEDAGEYPLRILRRHGVNVVEEPFRPAPGAARGVILSGSFSYEEHVKFLSSEESPTRVVTRSAWSEAYLDLKVEDAETGKVLYEDRHFAGGVLVGSIPADGYGKRFFAVVVQLDDKILKLFVPTTTSVSRSLSP